MRVTIHCLAHSVSDGAATLDAVWTERSFEPIDSPGEPIEKRGRFTKTAVAYAIEIEVPIGSRLVRHGNGPLWLSAHFNSYGLDATSAYHMARKGENGLSLIGVAGAVVATEPEPVPEPVCELETARREVLGAAEKMEALTGLPWQREIQGMIERRQRRAKDLPGQGALF